MAKSGRKPKPTALKLITGNPGNRPINEAEPQPARVYNPEPPAHLTRNEKIKWREMAEKLGACRVLTELDLDALEIYCREWNAMMVALADLNDRGKLMQTPGGSVMWNPSWAQYKHSLSEVRKLQSEFGLTPSSRTGIVVQGDEKGKDAWADF